MGAADLLLAHAVGTVSYVEHCNGECGGDLRRLADRFIELGGETVVRAATRDGTPGSPNVVPRALFPALMRLSGDTGGRDVLRTVPQDHVALDGRRAVTDLDTPADWAAWRAARDQS